jgi:GTPase SAR1 family protein
LIYDITLDVEQGLNPFLASKTPANGLEASAKSSPDTDNGLQILGRGVKELVQAVRALRHLGVEDLDLPLPKIVVVGDQSTGKSSLIEGMSEIKVPRSAGTCTRCPLEINLTEDNDPEGQWSCNVSLHNKYVYQSSLKERATKARPLGPWADSDGEDHPFARITSKDDVVDALERAQLATLNPSSSYEKYKPGNPLPDRTHQVKFSPNIIRLDISGPGLPNLSFFDLPGVINVSEVPNEAYFVDLVRNLVKEYIKAPDCINLLALTMTHDAANSSAFGLIQEMKAEPRTVGCLTKPDRMARNDALDQWAQILGGKAFQLGFGYHVIKNNQDPNVDHVTARQEEAAFFSNQVPWTDELSEFEHRFGTLRLQTALSQRLTTQIRTW